jgi:hypothetical protein
MPDGSPYPCKIYRHCDGYPESVFPDLQKFAADFNRARGVDPEYMLAQCLLKCGVSDRGSYTGYGVSTWWHYDIEWLYKVYVETGRVEVVKVRWQDAEDDSWPTGKVLTAEELQVYLDRNEA